MKNIMFIIILCYFLYKSGAVKNLLNLFLVAEATQPRRQPGPEPEPITEREKLEKQAHYILTLQGYTYPETVKYMGDDMLINIIREYLDY